VNPLLAYDVICLVGVALCVALAYDRPTRPTPRIVVRPPTIDVPPLDRPAWLDQADDTVTWTYRARRRQWPTTRSTGPAWPGPTFPDPPAPAVFRQPRLGLDGRDLVLSSVAVALGPA